MAKLINQTNNQVLVPNLQVAKTFWTRAIGLLGTKKLESSQGLWIHNCNSIHTLFMNFPIHCVFLDRELKVKKVVPSILPYRLVLPVWGAKSVVELDANNPVIQKISIGDQLHVEP